MRPVVPPVYLLKRAMLVPEQAPLPVHTLLQARFHAAEVEVSAAIHLLKLVTVESYPFVTELVLAVRVPAVLPLAPVQGDPVQAQSIRFLLLLWEEGLAGDEGGRVRRVEERG